HPLPEPRRRRALCRPHPHRLVTHPRRQPRNLIVVRVLCSRPKRRHHRGPVNPNNPSTRYNQTTSTLPTSSSHHRRIKTAVLLTKHELQGSTSGSWSGPKSHQWKILHKYVRGRGYPQSIIIPTAAAATSIP